MLFVMLYTVRVVGKPLLGVAESMEPLGHEESRVPFVGGVCTGRVAHRKPREQRHAPSPDHTAKHGASFH